MIDLRSEVRLPLCWKTKSHHVWQLAFNWEWQSTPFSLLLYFLFSPTYLFSFSDVFYLLQTKPFFFTKIWNTILIMRISFKWILQSGDLIPLSLRGSGASFHLGDEVNVIIFEHWLVFIEYRYHPMCLDSAIIPVVI